MILTISLLALAGLLIAVLAHFEDDEEKFSNDHPERRRLGL